MNMTTETNRSSVNVKISGMSCAVCATRIEKGLAKLTGVDKATVKFAAEKAAVTYDAAQVSLKDIAKKVEDLGYQIVTDKAEFKISGMSCAVCANRIEKALKGLPGVYSAAVNFAAEKATVEYNASELTSSQVQEKVKDAVETATGLSVIEVNVHVQGVGFSQGDTDEELQLR